ncbi:Flp pilus assembly protein CpaB [uncultured Roseibium sp.]|uniref:Flp pilus assembly protein CpaB n=1 Tax=uncultured Roseibium sp. TaxID=1936171 RepID=UPI00262FC36F|nr:Flp pilus assembly protein CpaB [uncultured Roseibium sp.]
MLGIFKLWTKLARIFVLLVSLGAGYQAFQFVTQSEVEVVVAPPPPEPVAQARVLVAAKDIQQGGKISDRDFAWVEWPKNAVPEGALTKMDGEAEAQNVIGSIARTAIYSGEPIRSERLIQTDKGYMATILPKGKRAIAVRVEQETSAGGFILPGDKVDLILTREHDGVGVTSETILENIRVLAIDTTTAGEQEAKNLSPKRTATLELTLFQSEVVVQAQQVGSIALALRSAEDSADNAEVSERRRAQVFVRVHPDHWSVGATNGINSID